MKANSTTIRLQNVVQRFRVIYERPDTMREAFSKILRRAHRSHYHDFEALKNISFSVSKGEMVGIVGRNGSGKSTILKVIAGIYPPSSGTVEVRGNVAPLIELGTGFQPELSGRENIMLNGLLLGFSRKEMREKEPSIVAFAELGDFIDAPVKQYSSGMYMRLAFSVATEVNPEILLVDEILAVGDAPFQRKCHDRIAEFRRAGKTIMIVSHDTANLVKFCERILLIQNGCLIDDGPAEQVANHYLEMLGQPLAVQAH